MFLVLVSSDLFAQETHQINAGGTSVTQSSASSNIISLKSQGIVSDANLDTGQTSFGTDQTAAIQAILNTASKTNPLNLLWDVKASCTGLRIKSYTKINVLPACGAILRDSSDNWLLSNYNLTPNSNAFVDSNITINGGIWNADGWRGGLPRQIHSDSAQGMTTGFIFFGVKNITLKNFTLLNTRTWGIALLNIDNILIDNFTIDDGVGQKNQDGITSQGYMHNVTYTNGRIRCGDDRITFCPNSTGGSIASEHHEPYTGVNGDESDIYVNNINFLGNGKGFAFYVQGGNKISDVHVSNITGTSQSTWLFMSNYLPGYTMTSGSQIAHNFTFENISVEVTGYVGYGDLYQPSANIQCSVDNLTFRNIIRTNWDSNGPTFYVQTSTPAVVVGDMTIDNYITRNTSPSNFPGNINIAGGTVNKLTLINSTIATGNVGGTVASQVINNAGTIGTMILSNNYMYYLKNFMKNSGAITYLIANGIVQSGQDGTYPSFSNTGTISNATFSNIICKQLTSGTFANADSTNIITY